MDPALDRKTDRLFTTTRALQWSIGVFVLGVVLPAWLNFAVLGLPATAVLMAGTALLAGAALVTALWHQQLRKHTGVPVLPILEDILEPFASSRRSWQEALDVALEEIDEGSPEDTPEWRELQQSARSALKAHRKATQVLTRQFTIHCELAAQADRRGWPRLRDRHVRTIARLVLQATHHEPETGVGGDSGHEAPQAH